MISWGTAIDNQIGYVGMPPFLAGDSARPGRVPQPAALALHVCLLRQKGASATGRMAFSWSAPASVLAMLLAAASCPAEGFFVPPSGPQSFWGNSLLQHTHDAASTSRTRAPVARGEQLALSSSNEGA